VAGRNRGVNPAVVTVSAENPVNSGGAERNRRTCSICAGEITAGRWCGRTPPSGGARNCRYSTAVAQNRGTGNAGGRRQAAGRTQAAERQVCGDQQSAGVVVMGGGIVAGRTWQCVPQSALQAGRQW